MEVELKQNEHIDFLEQWNKKIIQKDKGFCFGIDAVLLADFASVKNGDTVFDLGTGTGIIPLLICSKCNVKKINALEIQSEVADAAARSVKLNYLEEKISVLNEDIKNVRKNFSANSANVVVSNPPYMKTLQGNVNPYEEKAISRHEILCTLEDVADSASYLLNTGGKFFMIHRPERLAEICDAFKKAKLEIKRLRFVHPDANKNATMVLIEAVKKAKSGIVVEPPLFVYKDKNVFTDEINRIYKR